MYYLCDDDMTTYNVRDDFTGKGDSAHFVTPRLMFSAWNELEIAAYMYVMISQEKVTQHVYYTPTHVFCLK